MFQAHDEWVMCASFAKVGLDECLMTASKDNTVPCHRALPAPPPHPRRLLKHHSLRARR